MLMVKNPYENGLVLIMKIYISRINRVQRPMVAF